jgi:FG-GAP-like repeat
MKLPFLKLFTLSLVLFSLSINAQVIPFQKKLLLDSVAIHPFIADINHDGLNDIVCVSDYVDEKETDANVKHLCWLEAPSYKQHSIAKIIYRSCHIAVADIDRDGNLDIIGSDDKDGQDANGNEGLFWMKNPNKTGVGKWEFNRVGMTPYTKDILVSDFDGDGWMDIVSRSLHPQPDGSHGSHLDLFFSNKSKDFTKQRIETPAFDGTILGDIDHDGDTDIVINGAWMENPKQRNAEWKLYDYDKMWYNMSENGKVNWNHNNCRLGLADFDGDGLQDIVIASGESKSYPLVWYRGVQNPKNQTVWQKNTIDSKSEYTHTVRVGDMDNDGDMDIITGALIFWDEQKEPTKNPHPTIVYKNNGNGSVWEKQVLDNEGMYSGAVGDLGADGDLDIVSPKNYNMKPLSIWENKTSDNKLPIDKWQYIQVDNARTKWGDYAQPEWLRYFGTDAKDINNDGFKDIVAGRYVYINPKGDMTGKWNRIDFGENLDGMLFVDADNDENPDIIAEALPNIYWLEATDKSLTNWKKIKIAEIKETDHVNGQGYRYVQIIEGGKPEILLNGGDGVYMIEIPTANAEAGNWKKTQISGDETNDEGMSVGDVDGDGDIDIISSRNNGTGPKTYVWYANPSISKQKETAWKESLIGSVNYWPDRVEVADLNGDGMLDVVGSEERYPGLKPDASLYIFEQQRDYGCNLFIRHTLKTTWSMNNLDVADVDKDGDVDIVTNEHKGTEFRTLLYTNNGKGEFSENVIDTGHEHHLGTQFFDLDNDGDLDIIGAAWDEWKPFHVLRNDAIATTINKPEKVGSVKISESTDEGFEAFKIETATATYYYQKEAGGISSMLDKEGTDWIAWRDMGKDEYPKSLAGDYRGIPNCVRDGTTHPGFTQCNSRQINANTIESESKNGKWKYRWEFYDDYAKMTWLKVSGEKYWFLYEGPIDGFYDPKKQLWGNNKDGVRTDKPKLHIGEGVEDKWDFVYFGSTKGKETFYCSTNEDNDQTPDLVAFADNDFEKPTDGMMVFGFGRGKNNAGHYIKPMSFYIGFLQENIQAKGLKDRIKMKIEEIKK